ncbi:hypothetical protein C8J57DRAFT_1537762 [Mycena rebaudengoi]|nr:hypothetical protein C8J57DRAFT_1537762 [Mycena rebaudengoi]
MADDLGADVLQSDGWALEQGDFHGEMVEAIVAIPEAISAVFHPEFGKRLFGSFAIEANRLNRETSSIHVHAVHSFIEDFFYLVQLFVPGLISLVREEDYDDAGEGITARMLPSADWIGNHRDILMAILGENRVNDILVAVADSKRAFKDNWFRHECESDEDRMLDLTACDKECGYCGKWDYEPPTTVLVLRPSIIGQKIREHIMQFSLYPSLIRFP